MLSPFVPPPTHTKEALYESDMFISVFFMVSQSVKDHKPDVNIINFDSVFFMFIEI